MEVVDDHAALVTSYPELAETIVTLVRYVLTMTEGLAAGGAATTAFADVEAEVSEQVRAVARSALAATLVSYEPSSERVDVAGRVCKRRAMPSTGHCTSLWGAMKVARHLYREEGLHNGPTVVPLELRAGVLLGRWTPAAAKAVAHLHLSLARARGRCDQRAARGSRMLSFGHSASR